MFSGQKLLMISAVLGTAMTVTAQATNNTTTVLTPQAKCVLDRNCGDEASCIARCYGVPSPNAQDIAKTDACYAECNSASTNIEATEKCRAACNEKYYQPTGPVAVDTPAPTASQTSAESKSTGTNTSTTSGTAPQATEDKHNSASSFAVLSVTSLAAAFVALSVLL
ncbi:hypothetical protein K7432_008610 [Basidiobolus ranarum]|uniref:Uncharacterized protein n=1 Tax=Basidiobolus ranarum TaxID=34480 RepID=A0ABR2VZ69_9FUNG